MAHFSCSVGSSFTLSLLLISGLLASCSTPNEEASDSEAANKIEAKPEVVSLLGEDLYSRPDVRGYIANADRALAREPDNLDLILTVAEIRSSAWQYNGAIEMYDRAIQLAPDDWRPYRFRGHRYISIRQFDKAVADLEKARDLSPYSLNVSNHLGLAYYLQGRFDEAADEYVRCLTMAENPEALELEEPDEPLRTCMEVREQESTRVAITDWAYRALRRAGRDEEAQALLETIEPGWAPDANVPYYLALLFYKGLRTEEEVLSPENIYQHRYETLAYGIANWHLVEGEQAEAVKLLNEIIQDEHWPGFGRIAAEADLARMSR